MEQQKQREKICSDYVESRQRKTKQNRQSQIYLNSAIAKKHTFKNVFIL